jgi:CysZ protein
VDPQRGYGLEAGPDNRAASRPLNQAATQAVGPVRNFFTGMGMLGRGFGMYARSPRLLFLGLIPAVIAAVLIGGALFALFYFINDIAAGVTWFAKDWSNDIRSTVRLLAALTVAVGGVLLAVLTYAAVTLIIGDPFYEAISKSVDEQVGGPVNEASVGFWVAARHNLVDSVRLIALSVMISIPMFLAGFLPVVGQTVVPVVDAVIGGWMLAVELTGVPFNRRGMRLRDRRRLLRANRSLALGFGVPVFVIFLIPFAAVLVIPAAVAGATLLTRRVLGQPT